MEEREIIELNNGIKYLIHKERDIQIKNKYLDFSQIVIQLCSLDEHFPPADLWIDCYNCKNLSEIIELKINKKKQLLLLINI